MILIKRFQSSSISPLSIVSTLTLMVSSVRNEIESLFSAPLLVPPRTSYKRKNILLFSPSQISKSVKFSRRLRGPPFFYPLFKLGPMFPNGKDSTPSSLLKSGVYLFRCRDCLAAYIGETGCSFHTRIDDHIDAF